MLLLINGVCVRHNKFERHQKEVIWFHNTHRSMEVVFFELLEEEFLEEGHHNRKRWREVSFITTDATAKLVTGGYKTQVQKLKGSCNNEGKLLFLFEPSDFLTDFTQKILF